MRTSSRSVFFNFINRYFKQLQYLCIFYYNAIRISSLPDKCRLTVGHTGNPVCCIRETSLPRHSVHMVRCADTVCGSCLSFTRMDFAIILQKYNPVMKPPKILCLQMCLHGVKRRKKYPSENTNHAFFRLFPDFSTPHGKNPTLRLSVSDKRKPTFYRIRSGRKPDRYTAWRTPPSPCPARTGAYLPCV